mgnify:CR=1 FL=1
MLLKLCIMFLCHQIAPDFYYEECINDPNHPPYIEVHPNNKVFYSKEGSLYFKATGLLAIDSKYNGPNKCCIRYQYDDDKLQKEES